ncbi:MAG TPA: hypothetical protein VLG74_17565, partial [Blastocatellia bacterium]|nr:hypothetical protein [Blastocatellia bacterium]
MTLYKLALALRSRYHVARPGVCLLILGFLPSALGSNEIPKVEQVELQPLGAQIKRLAETMGYLGTPLSPTDIQALEKAATETDAARAVAAIQNVLDKHCLVDLHINPESRVKVTQG